MRDAIEQFRDAIRSAGVEPPDVIEPGKLHRFSTNGTASDDAGWCKLFADLRGGVFGDHRSGLSEHWQAKTDRVMTLAEREVFQRMVAESKAQAEAERRQRHEAAAQRAAEILKAATGDPATHPYAVKKRVPLGSLVKRGPWPQRDWDDALLVPIYGVDGRVWSIEAINADGIKCSLKDGNKRGRFYPLSKVRGASRVFIAEGVANAAVGVEVDKSPAVAALCTSNLKAVALAVRELAAPGADIIILADNDVKPDGSNPGLKAATEAARAVGGRVAIPELDGRKCDFWDVWNERGIDAVKDVLASAQAPEVAEQEAGATTSDGFFGEQRPLLVAVNLRNFLARELPPRTAILSPWMLTQSLSMIYSWRGVGKTHVALGIGYAIASGAQMFNWKADRACKVLYVDGEMPASALQERLARIVTAGEHEPGEGMLKIVTPDLQRGCMPDLATREGQETLNAIIDADTEVIILDNLSCLVRRGGRENEAESWLPVAEWALTLRARGKSVLFIHHSGKDGNQRGTSKREDLLDTVIALRRPPGYTPQDGAVFEVHYEKCRNLCGTNTDPFEARLTEDESGRQVWTTRAVEDSTYERVVDFAKQGIKQREIADELGVSKSTVCRHLQRATSEGKVDLPKKRPNQKLQVAPS